MYHTYVHHSYLVVIVDHLAGVDDSEVRLEPVRFSLGLRANEHVLAEVVLPREFRDDAHVFARLGTCSAVAVKHVPVSFFVFFNIVSMIVHTSKICMLAYRCIS